MDPAQNIWGGCNAQRRDKQVESELGLFTYQLINN